MPIEAWLLDFEPPRIEAPKSSASKKSFKLSRIPTFQKDLLSFLDDDAPAKTTSVPKETDVENPKKPIESTTKAIDTSNTKKDTSPATQSLDGQLKELPKEDPFDSFINNTQNFIKHLNDKNKIKSPDDEDLWEDDSIEEDEEIVSETLANILALQRQNTKAIKMYAALSLKFPEKSRLFAEKIKELE